MNIATEFPRLLAQSLETLSAPTGRFHNESDFKLALFHTLAMQDTPQGSLADLFGQSNTCVLHAEARPENGLASKADILVCNPNKTIKGGFNYHTECILELKKAFNKTNLQEEHDKSLKYKTNFPIYYIQPKSISLELQEIFNALFSGKNRYLLGANIKKILPQEYSFEKVRTAVYDSLENALNCYGKRGRQFHGFYWCNYEHEINKGISYPAEGDFVAQLYHNICLRLPNVYIKSEFTILKNKRIDLVIQDTNKNWAIAIEVKMNWDQFKRKYKEGIQLQEESSLILNRFAELKRQFSLYEPILVVIQGDKMYCQDNKNRSLEILAQFKELKLLEFSEERGEFRYS